MSRVLLSAIFATLGFSSPAFASDWRYVTSDSTGTDVYVDMETIRETSDYAGRYKLAWVKWDHSRDKSRPHRETKLYFKIKCDTFESGIISATRYRADGTVLSSDSTSYPRLTADIPDTIGYSTTQFVCEQ